MRRPNAAFLGALVVLGVVAMMGCGRGAHATLSADEPQVADSGQIAIYLTDDGTTVAKVVAWTRSHRDGMREIAVWFPYVDDVDYRLDSFSIEVTAGDAIQPEMLMEPPSYPWESTQFHRTEHGMRFEVPDVGDYGVGTVNFSFWVSENVAADHPLVIRAVLGVRQGEGTAEVTIGAS